MMQEFLDNQANPTLAHIHKLIASNGRLNAFKLTRELLDQTQNDFATISEVFAVLQMEFP
jgi:DNA-binding phage protein